MVAVFTDEAMQRIEAMRREQTARLAAQGHHLTVERDYLTHGWIVRNPRISGCCEVVSEAGECSCRQFRTWGRCEHAARVEEVRGASWAIVQGGRA